MLNTTTTRSQTISVVQDAIFAAYVLLFIVGFVNFALLLLNSISRLTTDIVTNIYVTNLAIAGATLVCSIPMTLIYLIRRTWILGRPVCILYWILEQSNKYSSILFLTILCIDRYLVIKYPVTSKRFRISQNAYCVSAACWVAVFTFLVPVYMYANSITIGGGRTICVIYWPLPTVNTTSPTAWTPEACHTAASFFLIFLLPSVANVVLYARVLKILRNLGTANNTTGGRTRGASKYKKTTMTILIVVICYVLCWTPYWCYSLLGMLGLTRTNSLGMMMVQNIILMLPYVNAAVNPILLILSNPAVWSYIRRLACSGVSGGRRAHRPARRGARPPLPNKGTDDGDTLRNVTAPDELDVML